MGPPFFRSEHASIHYVMRGRGEPVLLIHGLGCSGADWAFQVAELEKRFRVIVPDPPGSIAEEHAMGAPPLALSRAPR